MGIASQWNQQFVPLENSFIKTPIILHQVVRRQTIQILFTEVFLLAKWMVLRMIFHIQELLYEGFRQFFSSSLPYFCFPLTIVRKSGVGGNQSVEVIPYHGERSMNQILKFLEQNDSFRGVPRQQSTVENDDVRSGDSNQAYGENEKRNDEL